MLDIVATRQTLNLKLSNNRLKLLALELLDMVSQLQESIANCDMEHPEDNLVEED